MEAFFGDLLTQLQDAHAEVMASLPIPAYEDFTEGPGVISGVKEFIAVINWSEPFFKYLLAFHVVFYLFCFIWSRDNANRTAICLMLAIVMGLGMPYLNDLGSQYHSFIFVQEKNMNYFDSNGTFLAALFGAPIVLLSILLQIKLLYYVAIMMIKLKRVQMRHDAKKGSEGEDKKGVAEAGERKKEAGAAKAIASSGNKAKKD